ncbi:hypothetical protein ACFU1Q_11385 [Brachybacterium paraconglomeratum]
MSMHAKGTTVDPGRLRAEIEEAVDAYQRVFPPPYRLVPNLELAVAALAELDRAEAQLAALRADRENTAPRPQVQLHFDPAPPQMVPVRLTCPRCGDR